MNGLLSPSCMEAKAIVLSSPWAKDVVLNFKFLESDALAMVQTLNNGCCHLEFGELLLDAFIF